MAEPNIPIKFNNPRVENIERADKTDRTRPTDPPKSKKDFARLLQGAPDKEEEDPNDVVSLSRETSEDGSIAENQAAPTLFDLSRKKETGAKPFVRKPSDSNEKGLAKSEDSVSSHEHGDLAGALEVGKGTDSGSSGRIVDASDRAAVEQESLASKMARKRDTNDFAGGGGQSFTHQGDKEKTSVQFMAEQPDIAYVNPLAASAQSSSPVHMAEQAASAKPAATLQALMNQLVQQAQMLKDSGKTETTIVLKHPPLLAGANLIVTSFDSANKEFNISFENLTQQAKNLLDMRVNQESLLTSLHDKGYMVHILTTTTQVEHVVANNPQQSENRRDQERQQGGQQFGSRDQDNRRDRNSKQDA